MQKTSEAIDFRAYFVDKEVDSKIKANRDDLLHIVQADIKVLDSKIDSNYEVLNAKIDGFAATTSAEFKRLDEKIDTKIDGLASVIQSEFKRLGDKVDNAVSMKKWVIGLIVTAALAIAALIGPQIVALFR